MLQLHYYVLIVSALFYSSSHAMTCKVSVAGSNRSVLAPENAKIIDGFYREKATAAELDVAVHNRGAFLDTRFQFLDSANLRAEMDPVVLNLNPERNATILLNSGVVVDGPNVSFTYSEKGTVSYFGTKGRTQLMEGNIRNPKSLDVYKTFPGKLGTDHEGGFGSPLGRVSHINGREMSYDFILSQISKNHPDFQPGKSIEIVYQSGVKVKGVIDRLTFDSTGKNLLVITFKMQDAATGQAGTIVTGPKGKIHFDPSWGTYDMTVGEFITHVNRESVHTRQIHTGYAGRYDREPVMFQHSESSAHEKNPTTAAKISEALATQSSSQSLAAYTILRRNSDGQFEKLAAVKAAAIVSLPVGVELQHRSGAQLVTGRDPIPNIFDDQTPSFYPSSPFFVKVKASAEESAFADRSMRKGLKNAIFGAGNVFLHPSFIAMKTGTQASYLIKIDGKIVEGEGTLIIDPKWGAVFKILKSNGEIVTFNSNFDTLLGLFVKPN